MDKRRTKFSATNCWDGARPGWQVQAAEFTVASATQKQHRIRRHGRQCLYQELLCRCLTTIGSCSICDEALERMETAGYGKCVHCGEALPKSASMQYRGQGMCPLPGSHERGLLGDDED